MYVAIVHHIHAVPDMITSSTLVGHDKNHLQVRFHSSILTTTLTATVELNVVSKLSAKLKLNNYDKLMNVQRHLQVFIQQLFREKLGSLPPSSKFLPGHYSFASGSQVGASNY
jgi:hypothetical protein